MSKSAKKSKSKGTKAIKAAAKPKANPTVEVVTGQPVPKGKARGSDAKPTRVSALDAAAQVLQKSGQAMRSQEMIAAMAEQGLWSSPNGKTPHATLYAAILREINDKGGEARFRKSERGKFEYAA
ncbi:MAG: winged helix-turn-helix domain-containing protein [Phycisphaerae bacterium]